MGAALGYALTQSVAEALAVFFMLGVGMATPYVLLAWFPAWAARLPRPGMWMLRFKQFLAFPLYATVVWLVWVLGQQAGIDGAAKLLLALIALAFGLWCFGLAQLGPSGFFAKGAGRALTGAVLGGALWLGFLAAESVESDVPSASSAAMPANANTKAGLGGQVVKLVQSVQSQGAWLPYSAATVQALTAAGKPVFIDFTAAWCVSCQVNKKAVLQTATIERAFAQKGVELVRADWTRRDAAIAQALQSYGRSGVPVYVLLRPGKAPLVLPELLTSGIVLDALSTL
jgi:thiol:disulfide interchange protein DsbD